MTNGDDQLPDRSPNTYTHTHLVTAICYPTHGSQQVASPPPLSHWLIVTGPGPNSWGVWDRHGITVGPELGPVLA